MYGNVLDNGWDDNPVSVEFHIQFSNFKKHGGALVGQYYNAVTPFASGGQQCRLLYVPVWRFSREFKLGAHY